MIQKIAITTLLVIGTSLLTGCTTTQPEKQNKMNKEMTKKTKNKKMMVHDLIALPFPGGKMFKTKKIVLSDEQKVKLATIVRPIMHEKYNPLVQEIFLIEKSIQRTVKKKENFYDEKLQEKIDKISVLKKQSIEYKIKALEKLKTIFTPEQWQVWIKN